MAESREQRFDRLTAEPKFYDNLLAHVSNGGSYIEYCRTHQVSPDRIVSWINAEPFRARRYAVAFNASNEWLRQRIIDELKALSLADMTLVYDTAGCIKPIDQWPDSARAACVEVRSHELFDGTGDNRVTVGHVRKVKMVDKLRALEIIAKTQAMFKDQAITDGLDLIVEAIRVGQDRAGRGQADVPPPIIFNKTGKIA